MAKVRVRGSAAVYEGDLTTSLLNVLLRSGYPLRTLCGGHAQCGRDMIRVVSGAEHLSPVREREQEKLDAVAAAGGPAGPDVRLACQCYARGDVEIEVIGAAGSPRERH